MRFKLYRCIACVMLFLGGILVFGSSNVFAAITELDSLAEFTGEADGDGLFSVASAGDVNGDGLNDIVMGASSYSEGSAQGRVYLFYGSPSMSSEGVANADVILTGEAAGDRFGLWFSGYSTGGDVNDDGYDDIVVGAYSYNSNQGRAYVFYGGPSLSNKGAASADVILTGEGTGNSFGYSTSLAGDVNKDGYDDVIVGAYIYNSSQGRAYVFYGGPSMVSKGAADADVILTGEAIGDRFGVSVSPAGDVDNDGYSDVIAGAERYNGGTYQGRAYIFLGSSSMSDQGAGDADAILTGEADWEFFGNSVSSVGDINKDGYDDAIVGAFRYPTNARKGRAYIFYGSSSMTSKGAASADVILTGEADGDRFGIAGTTTGDVNNDGYNDVIVGAYWYSGGAKQGRAYIFYGGSSMSNKEAASADVILTGEGVDRFGYSVSLVHDLNGDGWNEWLIGASSYPSGGAQGKAYLYNLNYASPSISMDNAFYVNTPSPTITGTASETGVNVSGVQISVNNGAWTSCAASDGNFNSANENFSCPLSGLAEGTYSLRVRSYDENSVYVPSSLYATAYLVVDFTPPSDGVVAISAGGSYTNSQTVTLNISAFDALAGVSQMMISEDPNFEGAEWQPYSETVEFTLSGESGTKVIYVRFMDRAGNVSGVYSYRIELLTETGADVSHTFTLGLSLLGVLVFTGFRKVYIRD